MKIFSKLLIFGLLASWGSVGLALPILPYSPYHTSQLLTPTNVNHLLDEGVFVTQINHYNFFVKKRGNDRNDNGRISSFRYEKNVTLLGYTFSPKMILGVSIADQKYHELNRETLNYVKAGALTPEFWMSYDMLKKKNLSLDFSFSSMPSFSEYKPGENRIGHNLFTFGGTLVRTLMVDERVDSAFKASFTAGYGDKDYPNDYLKASSALPLENTSADFLGLSARVQKNLSDVIASFTIATHKRESIIQKTNSNFYIVSLDFPIYDENFFSLKLGQSAHKFTDKKDRDVGLSFVFLKEYTSNFFAVTAGFSF